MKYRNKKITWKGIWYVIKTTGKCFADDNVTKLSGSLAYFTIFSLAPMFVIILSAVNWLYGKEAVEGKLFGVISKFTGPDTAAQIQNIVGHAWLDNKGAIGTIIGIITLIIGATTVFAEIQGSINSIWGIKPKPKKGWLKMLGNRALSFSLIIALAFLLLVSLGLSALLDAFNDRLMSNYPEAKVMFVYVVNIVINFVAISGLFAVIFKVLPDAKIRWKDVFVGAMVTTILFMLGKFAISYYIGKSSLQSVYGTAASIMVLITWIYFSSLILYFGAEFTKAWAIQYGDNIYPNAYAVSTKIVEVETEGEALKAVNKAAVNLRPEADVAEAVSSKLEDGIPQVHDEPKA